MSALLLTDEDTIRALIALDARLRSQLNPPLSDADNAKLRQLADARALLYWRPVCRQCAADGAGESMRETVR